MKVPLGEDGQTTLFKDARGYEDSDIYDPLEAALAAGVLDASKIMAGGTPIACVNGTEKAIYRLEGNHTINPFDLKHLSPSVTLSPVWTARVHAAGYLLLT